MSLIQKIAWPNRCQIGATLLAARRLFAAIGAIFSFRAVLPNSFYLSVGARISKTGARFKTSIASPFNRGLHLAANDGGRAETSKETRIRCLVAYATSPSRALSS